MSSDPEGTGAADWRSETEKRKSVLRKACIALFKIWIPDHPEAAMARGEVWSLFREALEGWADQITFVSRLSTGVEDIHIYDFIQYQSLSMQDLLVQREGTDAFLDPKNALRVVRRKFGMMTLVARMAGTFEQRNCNAITLRFGMDEPELLTFSKMMTARVEGTAAEEEQVFKRRLRKQKCPHVDLLYHSEVIGRRMPVGWTIKRLYTHLHRAAKKRRPDPDALEGFAEGNVGPLGARHLRQLAMYAPDFAEDLDLEGLDPGDVFIQAADERLMLSATRSLFDDFRELKAERSHAAALDAGDSIHDGALEAEVADAAEGDFLAETDEEDEDDEFLRIAQALERVREARGPDFFRRISMVSGNLNFVDAALGSGLEGVESEVAELDPLEGLAKARAVTEPYYRARALGAAVPALVEAEKLTEAREAAAEALEAARKCVAEDGVLAYAAAVNAALAAGHHAVGSAAVREALGRAHAVKDPEERAASLMRVISTLMESGPLPAEVRSSLSAAILGDDVHFWDKKAVQSPLVEAILALLSGLDDDTIIFLRKVVSHPDVAVRRSVLRTVPFAESKPLRDMLVGHLKDPEPTVRAEVIERIGTSGDRKLVLYLVNHFRQGEARTLEEKRTLALAMARMDPARFLPHFNAMLGGLATKDDRFTDIQKPLKDDGDWQLAGLEVLYHLKDRDAKRLLFNAATKGRGVMKGLAERLWPIARREPYGEPALPRSPHDPDWTEADAFDLIAFVEAREEESKSQAPEPAAPEAEPEREEASTGEPARVGLFGRLKRLFGKTGAPEGAPPPPATGAPSAAPPERDDAPSAGPADAPADTPEAAEPSEPAAPALEWPLPEPEGPPRAVLRFGGTLAPTGDAPAPAGEVPMVFSLYRAADAPRPIWRQETPVAVKDGQFEVVLGAADDARLPGLPETVWLGIEVDGAALGRAPVSRRRRVVQG